MQEKQKAYRNMVSVFKYYWMIYVFALSISQMRQTKSTCIQLQLVWGSSDPLLACARLGFSVCQGDGRRIKKTLIGRLAVHPATSSLWQRLPFISCPVLSASWKTFIWQLLYEAIQANLHEAQQSCLLLKDFNDQQELFMSPMHNGMPETQRGGRW